MQFLINYQWQLFITIEILFLLTFLAFGFVRYFLNKDRLSFIFLSSFFALLIAEALLAFLIYQATGKIETFQIVIIIFVLYAVTFGIKDFKNLDRWMRQKIGKWRNVDLLHDEDYEIIERKQDSKYMAKKYRISATIHLFIFLIGQSILWYLGTASVSEMLGYLKDLSWFETGDYADSPYANETSYSIGVLWVIVCVIDL